MRQTQRSPVPDNHNGVITHLQPDILECEVKWALGSITTNKAGGGDGIPVELFQILKDDAVKVLHSICQQTWKTQQWPWVWKSSPHLLVVDASIWGTSMLGVAVRHVICGFYLFIFPPGYVAL